MSADVNLILLGPPGSGKGTQGELIQDDLDLSYFSTGDMLRAAVREGTDLGQSAKEFMDRGDLVPDEVMIGLIAERLEAADSSDGFILDGFPRTVPQAEALDLELEKLGHRLTAVILIDVSDEEIVNRLGGRRVCEAKGHSYHVEFNPPEQEGVCDIDGTPLYVRDDDKPETIRRRLEQYHEKTAPLVEYFQRQGLLNRVDGGVSPDSVAEEIRTLISTLRLEEES